MNIRFPAHHPYEDGWLFCNNCQRFIHPLKELYEKKEVEYPFNKCPECKTLMKIESGKLDSKQREINKDGLGLPKWAYLPEFSKTKQGLDRITEFKKIQEKIKDKIEQAPYNKKTYFRKLGAKKFKSHWFVKANHTTVGD